MAGSTPTPASTNAPAEPAGATVPSEPPLRLVEVAPGVFAGLQPPQRRFRDCNAAVLVAGDEVMLVDGPQRLAATRMLVDEFGLADPKRRLRLVTTHWHVDHSLAATFVSGLRPAQAPAPTRLGHAGLAPLLAEKGAVQLRERKVGLADAIRGATEILDRGRHIDGPLTDTERAEVEAFVLEARAEVDTLATIPSLLPPTRAIAEPTTTKLGDHVVELIPLQAHTDADLVVYLPGTRVLIAGDVVDELPFAGHGHPYRWLLALQQLRERPIDTIIAGHGDVLGPEHLDRQIELVRVVHAQACMALAAGRAPRAQYEEWKATAEFTAVHDAWVTDETSGRAFASFIPEMLVQAAEDAEGCR